VQSSDAILHLLNGALHRGAETSVSWAHDEEAALPLFADRDSRQIVEECLSFWRIVNNHVKEKGAFVPLKLFKHAAQSLYSKTKGGVDGSAQARSILRSSTSSFAWEQKIVSQTLKTLAVNAFHAWRMSQNEDLLQTIDAFCSLDHYRNGLNSVQSLADFVFDVAQELLAYADRLQQQEDPADLDIIEITDIEEARLLALARRRRGKRLIFFNSPDGIKLRLHVHPHNQRQLPGTPKYCCLCGSGASGSKRHRSTFKCTACDAHLCARAHPGQRKSCWSIWHEARRLNSRD
jgi:hypothetical protein